MGYKLFYFDGDPIYDTYDDGFEDEIAYLWSCEQQNIINVSKANFTMHEQPADVCSIEHVLLHRSKCLEMWNSSKAFNLSNLLN